MAQNNPDKFEEAYQATRSTIRNALFNHERSKQRSKVIDFFGTQVEVRQPTLGTVLNTKQDADGNTSRDGIIQSIIENVYVPRTQERVFEEADADALRALPFGQDMQRMTAAFNELSDIDPLDRKGTSGETPGASQ